MQRLVDASIAILASITLVCPLVLGDGPASRPATTQPASAEEPSDPVHRSSLRMRQLGQAIMIYANDHRGTFPSDLEALVAGKYVPADFLARPNPRTGATPAYQFAPPAMKIQKIRNPQDAGVLWELEKDGKRLDGGLVLYADGHVAPEKR